MQLEALSVFPLRVSSLSQSGREDRSHHPAVRANRIGQPAPDLVENEPVALGHYLAAVALDGLACDVASFLGSQERNERADV